MKRYISFLPLLAVLFFSACTTKTVIVKKEVKKDAPIFVEKPFVHSKVLAVEGR